MNQKSLCKLSALIALTVGFCDVKALAETDGAYTMQQIDAAMPHSPNEEIPEIKYELEKQPVTNYPGGFSHEVTAKNFPISKGIAGVSMTLNPGGLRELHWHANAAEWAYIICGHCRITVIDPQGRHEIKDFGPGDVWYFPRGHGHSLQGIGTEPCHFILAFDSGYFSEFATFSVSDWIAQTPVETLGKNFNLPASIFSSFPKKEVYISQGPVPSANTPASDNPPPLTHKFRLGEKTPDITAGGSFNVVDQRQFPISTTMSGAILKMQAGAMRQLHWHPRSDEWQYYISGHARMTVFGAKGRKITREFGPGDVGYVPMGYGHYIESEGDEPCEMLAVFNSGTYEEISLSEWLSKTPSRLLETNFGVEPSVIEALKKTSGVFSIPRPASNP